MNATELVPTANGVPAGKMRAAVVPGIGARWELRELEIPKPGPDEVLIKIAASGLCYTDVHFSSGPFLGDHFPSIFGHEPVGTIVAVGDAVTTRKVGDRVGTTTVQRTCERCEWCLAGREISCPNQTLLFVNMPGGHAQYMVAVAQKTTLIPDQISFEQAAPLFCAGYTVMSGIVRANPQPHETIAVIGIGGLGHLAIQYGRALGHRVVAVTTSRDKIDLARELGAHDVVSDGEGLKAIGGADIILSTANAYTPAVEALSALRPDGRLVLMGIADSEDLTVPGPMVFPNMMVNRWSIIGSQQNERNALELALQIAAAGKVRVLTETFPLDRVNEAFDRVAQGKARFRVVLTA